MRHDCIPEAYQLRNLPRRRKGRQYDGLGFNDYVREQMHRYRTGYYDKHDTVETSCPSCDGWTEHGVKVIERNVRKAAAVMADNTYAVVWDDLVEYDCHRCGHTYECIGDTVLEDDAA